MHPGRLHLATIRRARAVDFTATSADLRRLAAAADQLGRFTRDTSAGNRGVRDRGEAFPGHVVDNVQHPEAGAENVERHVRFVADI